MISKEEHIDITLFLNDKNLPLDLKVEIYDHITEQIAYKREIENKDFTTAFAEVKKSWQADLSMRRGWFPRKLQTKIHRDTIKRTNFEITKKSFLYFGVYFIISLFLIFYNKTLASNFIFGFYLFLVLIFAAICILNFKIINSTFKHKKTNISYLQAHASLLLTSATYIFFFILFNFDERFGKYYNAVLNLFTHHIFNQVSFGSIMIFNIYALLWFYGFLYFAEYKKSVKILEQKINLKI